MRRNRYDEGRMRASYDRGYGAPMRGRGRYDVEQRGGRYDRAWRQAVAFGRGPGATVPGMFTPFGWDPMMRWAGWDPLMGFVPYQDTPREWSYGLAGDMRRYDHPYYRGGRGYALDYVPRRGYAQDYRAGREGPGYGRGYDTGRPMQPRQGPRR